MDLLEDTDSIDKNHWYYRHKFRAILRAILNKNESQFKLADIGAGSAIFSLQLQEMFPSSMFYAIDINYSDIQLANSTQNFVFSRELVSADVYLLNDVLEHIQNPSEILDSIFDLNKNSYLLIITVPAFQALWSGHDVYLGHFRRYSKRSLQELFKNTERYSSLETYFLYQSLFPLAYLSKKLQSKDNRSQMKNHGKLLNNLFDFILRFEEKVKLRLPFGVSVFKVVEVFK